MTSGSRNGKAAVRVGGRAFLGSMILGAGLLGLGAASAWASPANAPSAVMGTFSQCSNGQSGTFVVNSGNTQAAQTWNVAHLTFDSGGTGIFVPTELKLTYTEGDQMFSSDVVKGSAPHSVTCMISAGGDGFSLQGTVIGNMIPNG